MTTSQQARADAMADAKTLLMATPGYYDPAYVAARCGDSVRLILEGLYSLNVEPWIYAREAAREAFRAVPGLRGEQ